MIYYFQDNLKKIIKALNISMPSFAARFGEKKSTVEAYLYRGSLPKHDFMLKLIELTGIGYVDLLTKEIDFTEIRLIGSSEKEAEPPKQVLEPEANYNRPKMMLSEIEILRKFEEIELRLSIIERKINIKD